MLLIKNGRVLDPASKTDGVLDVILDGEKITELGPPGKLLAPQGTEFFDASGLIVAPGFIDIHVHLREPGQESSETVETGTRAAARGGFTAVFCHSKKKTLQHNGFPSLLLLSLAKSCGGVCAWAVGGAWAGGRSGGHAPISGPES